MPLPRSRIGRDFPEHRGCFAARSVLDVASDNPLESVSVTQSKRRREAGMGDVVRMRRRERREVVVIEAAVGYADAEERWMQALDVLAEYAGRDDTKENET